MSFASCTGTTRETCRPPCELHFNAGSADAVCVPPLDALGRQLSARDLRRIKALLRGAISGPQTGVIDDALRNLHAGMRAFIDDRIKQHTSSQHRHTSSNWEQIATSITNEVLNDIQNTRCPICIEEFDDDARRAFVLACPSGLKTPIHIDCYRQIFTAREGGGVDNCPMCRQTIAGTHNEPPQTLASVARRTVSLANQRFRALVHTPEPPEGWPDRTWNDTFADALVNVISLLLLFAMMQQRQD